LTSNGREELIAMAVLVLAFEAQNSDAPRTLGGDEFDDLGVRS
jgi:hypothetical protein